VQQQLAALSLASQPAVGSPWMQLTPANRAPACSQFNTLIALTGVILYWRGVWNLFDV